MKKFNQVYRKIMESVKDERNSFNQIMLKPYMKLSGNKGAEEFLKKFAKEYEYDSYETKQADFSDADSGIAFTTSSDNESLIETGLYITSDKDGYSINISNSDGQVVNANFKTKAELISFLKKCGASHFISDINSIITESNEFKTLDDFLKKNAKKFKYDEDLSDTADTSFNKDVTKVYAYIDDTLSGDYVGIYINELNNGKFIINLEDPDNDLFLDKTLKNKEELVSFLKRNGASNLIKAF